MAELETEIAAYEKMRAYLENLHMGEWALVHSEDLIGTYRSFDEAASVAVGKFKRGPYLIRQVGAAPITMPASVVYNLAHA